MSEINVQLVREFFELHGFRVLTHWPHDADGPRGTDGTPLLFVEHTAPEARDSLGFLLRLEDIPALARAVVEVRAWHGDRVYPSVVENNAVLAHVAGSEVRDLALGIFGTPDFATVLVVSELPQTLSPRRRAADLLQGLGITHVIEFPVLLAGALQRVSAHANYGPSHTLQTLRLLKRYGFIRRQQLEFSFPVDPPAPARPPVVDVAEVTDALEPDDAAAPDSSGE